MTAGIRRAAMRFAAVALLYAGANVLFEATTGVLLGDSSVQLASMVAMAASLALMVLLIVSEVRLYRAVVAASDDAGDVVATGDKFVLGAALWFTGGLPMNLVSIVRGVLLGTDPAASEDFKLLLVQLAVTIAFALFAVRRFRR